MKAAKNYETRPTAELVPYAKNARTHSKAQVDQIAESIKRFGFTNPVLIDGSGGIIAGHGRVLAAKKLGIAQVPTLTVDHLSEDEKRAYILADNQIALNSEWDEGTLAEELLALSSADVDVSGLGFSDSELKELMGDVAPLDAMPVLKDGERAPFQQVTFTLHDQQVLSVKNALTLAKSKGDFTDGLNENSNGNALARICAAYLEQNGDR